MMANPPLPPPVPGVNKVVTAAPPPPGAGMPPPPAIKPTQQAADRQATVDEAEGEGEEEVERTFWQIPFVQDMLPFITSLLLHIALITLGLLTYKTVTLIVENTKVPVVIPDATIIEGAEVGGIPHPGLGGDETRDAKQDQFKDVPPDSTGISEKPSATLQMALVGGGGGENDDATIAVGLSGGAFGKGAGTGSGSGAGVGAGTGDGGGPLAPFGIPGGGGGIGPKSPFMGVSGNAMKVVYLCDATGTMLTVFDDLRVQLRRAVDVLKPIQSFNIVFFQEDSFTVLDKTGLVLAAPEMKRKAYTFLDNSVPHGTTNPIPGIRESFRLQPQLIYVLTDGFDAVASYDEVVDEFRKLNKDKKVKVNTIMVQSSSDPDLEKILKKIADENGGIFKMVRKEDMGGNR